MTDPIHEQLSAFHDGELASAESELLLKRLQRDPQLRATVGRYALIGEALRSKEAGGPSRDFAARISRAIEQEAAPGSSWRPIANWLKPVAGGAIAAGVAAVALVSLRVSNQSEMVDLRARESVGPAVPQVAVVQAEAPSEPLPRYTVPLNAPRSAPPIQVVNNGRLANFVMAHSEFSSPLGQRNVLTGLLVEEPVEETTESQASSSPERERSAR